MATSDLALAPYFASLRDPRRPRRRLHALTDLIVIAICAVICGADTWPEVAAFGRRRLDWLRRFLPLANGAPSHDTFERVFARLNPRVCARCFGRWTAALAGALGLKQIAIDGKALRGSACPQEGLRALHLVSAWATENHLSLCQVAVSDKSNEITAIPKLLEMLDLNGALVSIDAMGTQKDIAAQIVDGGGDYVLTVKDNQPHLAQDIRACFAEALENDFQDLKYDEYSRAEQGHGRQERRTYTVIYDPKGIRHLELWKGLCVIGLCYSERTVAGKTSEELRYFIGSRRAGAAVYGQALRDHWSIENNLHWHMDVTFGEDESRIKDRNTAQNFALLRRLALSLLKRHPGKGSVATKRFEAALDTSLLEEILQG